MKPIPKTTPIETLRERITSLLHIPPEDRDVIDFILAVYVSNRMPGDPLWGMIVDASGGGKTELLRAFRKRTDSYFLSSLTDKTLVSGYRNPRGPKKDPSLLPQLNGKVLIIKDLSPLLSMRRETRNAIIGDLRDCYDGFSDHGRGNVGRMSYESKFSLIAATTLAIERFDAVDQELGERFVKFRMRSNENRAKVQRAIRNVGTDDSMREDIESALGQFLDSLPENCMDCSIPDDLQEALAVLSDLTATARSYVSRDRSHAVKYIPRPEVGTRLGKELAKLLVALAIVRGKQRPDVEDLHTVCRVAEDCLPPNRLLVLRNLRRSIKPLSVSRVSQEITLPWSTTKQTLEDLRVLGVVSGPSKESSLIDDDCLWHIAPEWDQSIQGLPLLL